MKPKSQPVVNLITGWQPSLIWAGGQMLGCWKIAAISVLMRKIKTSWWDLSVVLRFPLSSPGLTNHISHHYWTFTQLTHHGTDTIVLFPLSWFSWPPMLMKLCSMFRFFFVMIAPYHIFLLWCWHFCLLSAPLWFHCLHILYCYLFLAIGLCTDPALNYLVYK